MSTYLGKDDILKADDLPVDELEVPEWGGTIRVRGLTGVERDRWELAMSKVTKDPSKAEVRAPLVARCIVGEDGLRLFRDDDVKALGKKSGAALDRVFDKVRELSGMGDDQLKEVAEDFGDAPSDGSSSGSPAT